MTKVKFAVFAKSQLLNLSSNSDVTMNMRTSKNSGEEDVGVEDVGEVGGEVVVDVAEDVEEEEINNN